MYIEDNNGMFYTEFPMDIKNAKNFDIYAKFWSSMRKRIREEDGIDLVAIFIDKEAPTIRCMMLPNRANDTGGDYSKEEFEYKLKTLKKDIPIYLDIFVEYLEGFKKSEEYIVYKKLLKKEEEFMDDSIFHKTINPYLIRVGLKTLEDEIKKEEEKTRLQKIKEENKL